MSKEHEQSKRRKLKEYVTVFGRASSSNTMCATLVQTTCF